MIKVMTILNATVQVIPQIHTSNCKTVVVVGCYGSDRHVSFFNVNMIYFYIMWEQDLH